MNRQFIKSALTFLVATTGFVGSSWAEDPPGYVCYKATGSPNGGSTGPGPAPMLYQPPIYIKPDSDLLRAKQDEYVTLGPGESADFLALLSATKQAQTGLNVLKAARELEGVEDGAKRFETALPKIVEQLKAGKTEIRVEVE